jgi:DNA-binding transcriptional ArsR family regulator
LAWWRALRLAAATLAALALLLGGKGVAAAGDAPWLTLRSGTVTSAVDGVARSGPVNLSYHWDRMQQGRPGTAQFDLPFVLAQAPVEPWGIFIPRAGNAFEVHLNGKLLQVFGNLSVGGGADYAKSPLYVPVPAHLLKAGSNELRIRLRADSGRRAGLSPVTIGPGKAVRSRLYEPSFAWRFTGSVLLTAFSIVVGVIALALWLTQVDSTATGERRRANLYLWAALAEFCWALRVADGAIREPPLPWVAWGTLMTACYSGWAGSVIMFCQHLAGWHEQKSMRWLRRGVLFVFSIPVVVCYFALSRARPEWLTAWLALEIAAVAAYLFFFIGAALRRPNLARVMVALVASLTVAAAARDWTVIRLTDAYGDTTWVRYTATLFGMALLGIVVSRFREASARARDLLHTLAVRVADREQELAVVYGRLERNAREQARTQERERILRDMHDGVGSHISAAIRQLQSGQASDADVLHTLRDSGPLTLTELTRSTGLSRPTVEGVVEGLAETDLVVEVPAGPDEARRQGRPARRFRFHAESGHLLGIEIGVHQHAGLLSAAIARRNGYTEPLRVILPAGQRLAVGGLFSSSSAGICTATVDGESRRLILATASPARFCMWGSLASVWRACSFGTEAWSPISPSANTAVPLVAGSTPRSRYSPIGAAARTSPMRPSDTRMRCCTGTGTSRMKSFCTRICVAAVARSFPR